MLFLDKCLIMICFYYLKMSTIPQIKLPYFIPEISKVVKTSSGLRPIREAGIRMERTNFQNKIIYHDYGHGGAGISIAYGCAKKVIEKFFQPGPGFNQEIAVLGAGSIGLSTAYLLLQKGFKVNVYAQLLPYQPVSNRPELTSTVAAGYWMPIKLANRKQAQQFSQTSWKHFQDIQARQKRTGEQLGITKIPCYCINDKKEQMYMAIQGVIDPKDCLVDFGEGVKRPAKMFDTYIIENEKYLPFLIRQMNATGRFKIVQQRISGRQDVLRMKETHIFNCTGIEGAAIFGDTSKMKQLKGHVTKFYKKDYPNVLDFMLTVTTDDGKVILQIPHVQSGYLALGISFEQGKKDAFYEQQQRDTIINRARNFYGDIDKKIRPKL